MNTTLQIIVVAAMFFGGLAFSIWVLWYTIDAKEFWVMSSDKSIKDLREKLAHHETKLQVLIEDLDKHPSAELLKLIAIEQHHIRVTKERLKRQWEPVYPADIREVNEK